MVEYSFPLIWVKRVCCLNGRTYSTSLNGSCLTLIKFVPSGILVGRVDPDHIAHVWGQSDLDSVKSH